jgi:hypothetical protein
MTVVEVLEQMRNAGVRLAARDDRLRLIPKSRVTPEIVELARQHKPELLSHLKDHEMAETAAAIANIFPRARLVGLARKGEPGSFDVPPPLREMSPCPVCKGACRWCNTPGVVQCGGCYPRLGGSRHA